MFSKILIANRVKLLAMGFTLFSAALLFWLFVNWFAWSMADFDCDDGYWTCRRELIGPMALQIGLPLLGWLMFAWLLVRECKRG